MAATWWWWCWRTVQFRSDETDTPRPPAMLAGPGITGSGRSLKPAVLFVNSNTSECEVGGGGKEGRGREWAAVSGSDHTPWFGMYLEIVCLVVTLG